MGRKASGWKLRRRGPGRVYTVRFWIFGQEYERSTGCLDGQRAAAEASKIYAHEVGRAKPKPTRVARATSSFEGLVSTWLVDLQSTHASSTIKTWKVYANRWIEFFGAVHHVNESTCERYMLDRLREVQRNTVILELSCLTGFVRWLVKHGFLGDPVKVPKVPRRTLGTKHPSPKRKAAISMSPDECERLLKLLPKESGGTKIPAYPVRARLTFQYHTALRPSTLDKLRWGLHYTRGSNTLTITRDIDKARYARDVPLSDEARKAIDAISQGEHGSLIWGAHDYRQLCYDAAEKVLGKRRADDWCPAHLRSARITHLLEKTSNVPGVQFIAGHVVATTTARYVRPSARAARDVHEATKSKPARRRARRAA